MRAKKREVRVTYHMRIDEVNRVVHDFWFDLSDVRFDQMTGVLEVPFSRPPLGEDEEQALGLRQSPGPTEPVESVLRIHHVREWVVHDREKIGLYDFNEIKFLPASGRVEISTGVPLELYAMVERFEVSVTVG